MGEIPAPAVAIQVLQRIKGGMVLIFKNKEPFWYKVIAKFKDEKKITEGLTIPFLIGAYKKKGDSIELDSSECIKFLLQDIFKYKNPVRLYLCDCYDVIENIIAPMIQDKDDIPFDNLYVSKDVISKLKLTEASTEEELIESLYKMYESYLTAKTFSIEDRQFREYDEEEKKLIEDVIDNYNR
ncbi:MAG: hypothetical protein LBJ63_04390 [Prevotellaceae bacterium]|jgi:hypothetical protein|nr:hypothetical protein [Prevotellaceae bacterium]